ncbi:SIR2 family protein [Microbacterium maritypicum]|uniref:SIR2 family protein n=1 Tax=Microbacterium TaxID=33882 RepID=UPI00141EE3D2|nr:SIR2 family protein [Microbacterium sp. Be9]NIG66430.1 hypothetical protein [Microbacterium sp. Be9]
MRTAVLLGAGASFDAGLKTTFGLAQEVVRRFNARDSRLPPGVREALNFVYSEMVAHRGRHGDSPLEAVNTERLISAVRLLKNRDEHEADPFVASWKSAPGIFSATASAGVPDLRRALYDAQYSEGAGIDPERLALAIRQIASDRHDHIFDQLEEHLLKTVSSILAAHGDVGYLRPLIDLAHHQDGVDIATLNYDLTLEAAAAELSAPVHRRIDQWVPGTQMTFESEAGHMNLFKLHGSLDWQYVSAETQLDEWSEAHDADSPFPFVAGPSVRVSPHGPVDRPAIIIGDREKLNGEGPTLALIASFERALSRATHLAVVGYSFTDVHVNALVRTWVNADPTRTISVIDPGWPSRQEVDGFRRVLIDALRPERVRAESAPPRLDVIFQGAKDALPTALDGIRPRPVHPVTLEIVRGETGPELRAANDYALLQKVTLYPPFATPDEPNVVEVQIGKTAWGGPFAIGAMLADEHRTAPISGDLAAGDEFTVTVEARDHQDWWSYAVALQWPADETS